MEQKVKIKCPHCGWVRSLDVEAYAELETDVARGLGDELRQVIARMRDWLIQSDLDEANAWLDMPPCPHCRKTYRYNIKTRQVQP